MKKLMPLLLLVSSFIFAGGDNNIEESERSNANIYTYDSQLHDRISAPTQVQASKQDDASGTDTRKYKDKAPLSTKMPAITPGQELKSCLLSIFKCCCCRERKG